MASYSAEQRKAAKEKNQHLVTISAGGIEFSGPTSEAERDQLAQYLLDFLKRRRSTQAEETAKPK